MAPTVDLLLSFASADDGLRAECEKHISVIERTGLVRIVHVGRVGAGKEWLAEYDDYLRRARIVLLLISADFLASIYCSESKVQQVFERHRTGDARILPVLVRDCDLHLSPFAQLAMLPKGGKAVTLWADRDAAWANVTASVRNALVEFGALLGGPTSNDASTRELAQRARELQAPSREQLHALEAEIQRLRFTCAADELTNTRQRPEPIPVLLPSLRGMFVDRDNERARLREGLFDTHSRVIVVVAPAGHGKTELVTKLLQEVAPNGIIATDGLKGILYVRCTGSDVSVGRLFTEAGKIAGRPDVFSSVYADERTSLDRKLEFFLAELSRLGLVWIVFDNFEDMLSDDDTVANVELRKLLEFAAGTAHQVRVTITSRVMPRLPRSQGVYSIDLSQGLPDACAIEYLQFEGNGYGLGDVRADVMREIVRRLHGIPKALESIIGYLSETYPVVTLEDLMAHDDAFRRFDKYDSESGLKGLVTQQLAHQSDDAKLAVCALSIFRTSASLPALQFMLPALTWERILPRLQRNRLTRRQGDCYELHPLVRECARALLPERADSRSETLQDDQRLSFDRPSWHARAADFFVQLRRPKEQWATISDVEPQLQEFYHRVQAGDHNQACSVLNEIQPQGLGRWGHYSDVVEKRLLLAGKVTSPRLQVQNGLYISVPLVRLGNAKAAIDHLSQALVIAREHGEGALEIRCLNNLGIVHFNLWEVQDAIKHYEAALKLAVERRDRSQEGIELGNLGECYLEVDRLEEATAAIDGAMSIASELGRGRLLGTYISELGEIQTLCGDYDEAKRLFDSSLAIARQYRDRYREASRLRRLGNVFLLKGRVDEAISMYLQGLSIAKETGSKTGMAPQLGCLAYAYHQSAHPTEALAYYSKCLELDVPSSSYACMVRLGLMLSIQGDPRGAEELFRRGEDLCSELIAKSPRLWRVQYMLGLLHLARNDSRAAATYRMALDISSLAGVVRMAQMDLLLLPAEQRDVGAAAEVARLLQSVESAGTGNRMKQETIARTS